MQTAKLSKQGTLKSAVEFTGVGLHSGNLVRCVVRPADVHTGIVFSRSDLPGAPKIKADISKVVATDMCTTLGHSNVRIATVEHLMAALFAMGITNAVIEVNAPEIPILDGSSQIFVNAFLKAGVERQSATRRVLVLKRSVSIRTPGKSIEATPSDSFSIDAHIDFDHRTIGNQRYQFGANTSFEKEIASARTFGFLKEVEYLRRKGLAKGGSLENAVVLDDSGVLNPTGLRYQDEFVRHKVLDCIGDLALLGMPFIAKVEAFRSGHDLHAQLLKKILDEPSCYTIIESPVSLASVSGKYEEEEFWNPPLVASVGA